MTLEEIKKKIDINNEVELLNYINNLENNYNKLKEANEEHRKQVGYLLKKIDEG